MSATPDHGPNMDAEAALREWIANPVRCRLTDAAAAHLPVNLTAVDAHGMRHGYDGPGPHGRGRCLCDWEPRPGHEPAGGPEFAVTAHVIWACDLPIDTTDTHRTTPLVAPPKEG